MAYYIPIVMNNLRRELEIPLAHNKPSSKAEPKKDEILQGVGVDGIILNYKNANEIRHKYGSAYDLFDINGYSIEMKYTELGLSCFFNQADPERKIFSARIWKEFNAFQKISNKISSGIKPYLVLHDVFSYEIIEEEALKSYDETYFVNYGFFRYHFYRMVQAQKNYLPLNLLH